MTGSNYNNENAKVFNQGGTQTMSGGQNFDNRTGTFFTIEIDGKQFSEVLLDEWFKRKMEGVEITLTSTSGLSRSTNKQGSVTSATSVMSFGEDGSYFLSITIGEKTLTRSVNIPKGLAKYLPGQKDVGLIQWLSLGPRKSFFMKYVPQQGGSVSSVDLFKNDGLEKWVLREPVARDKLKVIFGPKGSYVALQPGKGMYWKGVPDKLEKEFEARSDCPIIVALGSFESYIAAWADGYTIWGGVDFRLRHILEDQNKVSRIVFAALNPHEDNHHFFVQWDDGKISYMMPPELEKELTEVTGARDSSRTRILY